MPSVYRALLEQAPRHAPQAVAGLRRVVSAGEALPPALFHAWQARFGQEILDGLGSTEALHIFLSNRPGACTPGSPGRPVPGYDVRVVDEGGVPVAAGTPGGLLVRGDSIAAGYWQRAEATRRTFRGEWLATGDQVVENADGSFQLLGRTDDMLKVSGQWVSPPEVEGVVATVDGVRECAVIGAADNDGVTEVIARSLQRAGCRIAVITAKDKLRALLGKGLALGPGKACCFSAEKSDSATLADNRVAGDVLTRLLQVVGRLERPPQLSHRLSLCSTSSCVRV